MMLSVIVCTYNRAESLRQTLQALKRQSAPANESLEVLVIDNRSTDHTKTVIEQEAHSSRWPIRYLYEPRQGKSYALNRGVEEARGAWVLLTDDDVVPESGWAQTLVQVAQAHQADVIGGRILPLWAHRPPEWLTDDTIRPLVWSMLALLDYGPEPLVIRAPGNLQLYGSNLAIRRTLIDRIGAFRTDLGPLGTTPRRGEDSEWLNRALAAGGTLAYAPQAIVYHRVPATRMRMSYLRQRRFHGSRSAMVAGRTNGHGVPRWLVRETLTSGLAAMWAYVRGARTEAVSHELTCWSQLGQMRGLLPGFEMVIGAKR